MTIVRAVDVSSHQLPSLALLGLWIGQGAQILWVHSYHGGEAPGLDTATRAWIDVARQVGIWCLPYCWLFRSYSASQAVRESIEVFRSAGADPKLIALDCENYGTPVTDPGPTAEQILSAAEQARALGVEVVLYSNKPWLDGMDGDHEILRGVPSWIANYSTLPSLNVPAPDWVKVLGHQYTSAPVDWSIFDLDALKALIDPCVGVRAERDDYAARIAAVRALALSTKRFTRNKVLALLP